MSGLAFSFSEDSPLFTPGRCLWSSTAAISQMQTTGSVGGCGRRSLEGEGPILACSFKDTVAFAKAGVGGAYICQPIMKQRGQPAL